MRLAESQKRSASFCNGFLRYIFSFHSCRYYRNDLTSYEQRFIKYNIRIYKTSSFGSYSTKLEKSNFREIS